MIACIITMPTTYNVMACRYDKERLGEVLLENMSICRNVSMYAQEVDGDLISKLYGENTVPK